MNDSEQSFVSSLLGKLDRLRSLSQVDILADWRIDPSGVDLAADPSQWDLASLNEKGQIAWERGRQEIWLAQKLVMPTDIGGYPVISLTCRLALLGGRRWRRYLSMVSWYRKGMFSTIVREFY